jgi:AcrR family transcriptional regulator
MSTPASQPMTHLLSHGRTQQKQRTQSALIAAARKLVGEGRSPTVEDAAEAAQISRTTAYRYFRNQAELLAASHPEIGKTSLLPANPPTDVEERLDIVVKEIARILLDGETHYRTMLRLSLDPTTPREALVLRQGRAIGWLEDALAPLRSRWAPKELRRLAIAIRSATGIEAFVWLVDVAALSRKEAVKTMRWSARTLLLGAIADHGKPPRRS